MQGKVLSAPVPENFRFYAYGKRRRGAVGTLNLSGCEHGMNGRKFLRKKERRSVPRSDLFITLSLTRRFRGGSLPTATKPSPVRGEEEGERTLLRTDSIA